MLKACQNTYLWSNCLLRQVWSPLSSRIVFLWLTQFLPISSPGQQDCHPKKSKPLIDNIRCYPLIATKYMQNSRSFFFSLKIWVQIRFLWQKRLVVWDRLGEQMGILARRITRRVIRQDRRICRKQRQICHIDMSKIHFQKYVGTCSLKITMTKKTLTLANC